MGNLLSHKYIEILIKNQIKIIILLFRSLLCKYVSNTFDNLKHIHKEDLIIIFFIILNFIF